MTLTNVYFARKAPTVSFIHNDPGQFKPGSCRGTTGILSAAFVINTLGPMLFLMHEEEIGAGCL